MHHNVVRGCHSSQGCLNECAHTTPDVSHPSLLVSFPRHRRHQQTIPFSFPLSSSPSPPSFFRAIPYVLRYPLFLALLPPLLCPFIRLPNPPIFSAMPLPFSLRMIHLRLGALSRIFLSPRSVFLPSSVSLSPPFSVSLSSFGSYISLLVSLPLPSRFSPSPLSVRLSLLSVFGSLLLVLPYLPFLSLSSIPSLLLILPSLLSAFPLSLSSLISPYSLPFLPPLSILPSLLLLSLPLLSPLSFPPISRLPARPISLPFAGRVRGSSGKTTTIRGRNLDESYDYWILQIRCEIGLSHNPSRRTAFPLFPNETPSPSVEGAVVPFLLRSGVPSGDAEPPTRWMMRYGAAAGIIVMLIVMAKEGEGTLRYLPLRLRSSAYL
ncbi:hypothetical protein C7M84_006966, partial [Penaeus vannamei]